MDTTPWMQAIAERDMSRAMVRHDASTVRVKVMRDVRRLISSVRMHVQELRRLIGANIVCVQTVTHGRQVRTDSKRARFLVGRRRPAADVRSTGDTMSTARQVRGEQEEWM
jgi:hypothetical protein